MVLGYTYRERSIMDKRLKEEDVNRKKAVGERRAEIQTVCAGEREDNR